MNKWGMKGIVLGLCLGVWRQKLQLVRQIQN